MRRKARNDSLLARRSRVSEGIPLPETVLPEEHDEAGRGLDGRVPEALPHQEPQS